MAYDPKTQCAICGLACQLESCVTDEDGRAVHDSCYQKKLSSKFSKTSRYDEVEDLLQQARELREVADQLLKKSDRLIAAYKQLTGHVKRPLSEH